MHYSLTLLIYHAISDLEWTEINLLQVSQGKVYTLNVRREINHFSKAYSLSNICTKNYWNWTATVKITVGDWVVSYWDSGWRCVCIKWCSKWFTRGQHQWQSSPQLYASLEYTLHFFRLFPLMHIIILQTLGDCIKKRSQSVHTNSRYTCTWKLNKYTRYSIKCLYGKSKINTLRRYTK